MVDEGGHEVVDRRANGDWSAAGLCLCLGQARILNSPLPRKNSKSAPSGGPFPSIHTPTSSPEIGSHDAGASKVNVIEAARGRLGVRSRRLERR